MAIDEAGVSPYPNEVLRDATSYAQHLVRGVLAAWASTFGLTMTNPATILSFLGVFAGLGLTSGAAGSSAVALVAGVFLGSAAWWLTMSLGVGSFRERLDERALRWVNRISGAVITLFGVGAFASLLL